MTWAQRPQTVPKNLFCPRCNKEEKVAELIIQARSTKRPKPGAFGTRSRRLCESCARELFEKMENLLDSDKEQNG